jgi:hypothetical protein
MKLEAQVELSNSLWLLGTIPGAQRRGKTRFAKFEAQVELSCMQSIHWYPIAKGYWKLSRKAEGNETPQLALRCIFVIDIQDQVSYNSIMQSRYFIKNIKFLIILIIH